MPFTKVEISFFNEVIEFLNVLESNRLRVFFGHYEEFKEWLEIKSKNIVKFVSNYKPLKKYIYIGLNLVDHQILD